MSEEISFEFNFLPDPEGFYDKDPRFLGHNRGFEFDSGFFIGSGEDTEFSQAIFTKTEWGEIREKNPDFHLPRFNKNDVRFEMQPIWRNKNDR